MLNLSQLALAILPTLLAGTVQAATLQSAAAATTSTASTSAESTSAASAATSTVTTKSRISSPLYLFIDDQVPAAPLRFNLVGDQQYRLTPRLAKGSYRIQIANKGRQCGSTFGPAQMAPLPFGKANPLGNCAAEQHYQLRVLLDGNYDFTLDNINADAPTLTVL